MQKIIIFSLFLIPDSVSLYCISALKELKISRLKVLAKPLKACSLFVIFIFSLFLYHYVKE